MDQQNGGAMPLPENMSGVAPSEKAMGAQTTADSMLWFSGEEQASPEEQAAYDEIVGMARKMLTTEGADVKLAKSIKDNPLPADGIATVADAVMGRAIGEFMKGGQKPPVDAIGPAIVEVHDAVLEMAENAGVPLDQDIINASFIGAADNIRTTLQSMGVITQAEAQESVEELKQLQASGSLDQMLKGAETAPQAAPEQPAAAPSQGGFGAATGA